MLVKVLHCIKFRVVHHAGAVRKHTNHRLMSKHSGASTIVTPAVRHSTHSTFQSLAVMLNECLCMRCFQTFVVRHLLRARGDRTHVAAAVLNLFWWMAVSATAPPELTTATVDLYTVQKLCKGYACVHVLCHWKVSHKSVWCAHAGLFRAKGFLWFDQQHAWRYIFHYSGKQRVECRREGVWEQPPANQLVMIGQHYAELQHLQQELLRCTAGKCKCGDTLAQQQQHPSTDQDACTPASSSLSVQKHAHQEHGDTSTSYTSCQQYQNEPSYPAASTLCDLIVQHPRFHLADTEHCVGGMVQFSVQGSSLHGVLSEQVWPQKAAYDCFLVLAPCRSL